MDATDLESSPTSDAERLQVDQAVAALRALPFGGIDDATRNFALPPSIRSGVSPALRHSGGVQWGLESSSQLPPHFKAPILQ